MICLGDYLIQQIQMRMHYHRMKSNPFSSLKDRKSKAQNRSIDDRQQVESLNPIDKLTSEEKISTKYRNKSFAKVRDSSANLDIGANLSFKDLGKQLKSKRTLVEENEELKKKLETLMHNKTSRKSSVAKKLSTQFEKEIYWNGSQSYMISGIKLQYQKMKDSYQKKSEDYEDLMRSAMVANNMEFLAYIEALEVQNHILARQLEGPPQNKVNIDDQTMLILQLRERCAKYQTVISEQRQKNRKKGGEIKKLKSKITFLEKLVISKDNNEHLAYKNAKKLEKQKAQLQKRITQLEQKVHVMGKDHQNHVSRMETFHKQNLELQLNKQASSTKEQHDTIHRLMRQNRYLQGLIDSWKAQKNPQRDHKNSRQEKQHHSHHYFHHKDSTANRPKNQKQPIPQTHSENLIDNKSFMRSILHQVSHEKQIQHKQESQSEEELPKREPYSADCKNSEHSVKNRRVQAYEIEDIIQFTRFRLIAEEHSVEWVVSKFEGTGEKWSNQYISMGEARHVLENQLRIPPPQSLLLARYLIQHSNQEFVYTDDLNEYARPVVKSIIKALFGNYSIFTDEKSQFVQTLQSFRSKLQWMLESTTKGGIIARDKFNDLLQSLSINCKSGLDIFCIARMASKSQNLEKLQYKYLFEGLKASD